MTKRGLSLSTTRECCCGGISSPKARRPPEALVFERAHHRRHASSKQVGFPPASLGSPDFSRNAPRRLCECHLQRRSSLHRHIRKRRHSGDHGPFMHHIWRCRQCVKCWCRAHANSVAFTGFRTLGRCFSSRSPACPGCGRPTVRTPSPS